MGFTIDDALREFKKNYKMTLLAGEDGCSNAMTWVQKVEDKTILQQLWGKELVVTTGLGFQSQKKLKEFIENLLNIIVWDLLSIRENIFLISIKKLLIIVMN